MYRTNNTVNNNLVVGGLVIPNLETPDHLLSPTSGIINVYITYIWWRASLRLGYQIKSFIVLLSLHYAERETTSSRGPFPRHCSSFKKIT